MAWHARLAASNSKRWLNCPGSVLPIEALPSSPSGNAARLGTATHFIGHLCLSTDSGPDKYRNMVVALVGEEEQEVLLEAEHGLSVGDELDSELGTAYIGGKVVALFPVNDDMIGSVGVYLDACYAAADRLGTGAEWLYEHKFDKLQKIHPDLGGTGDAAGAVPYGHGEVLDLKNGRVLVEVNDNTQLKEYALGLLLHFEDFDLEGVRVTIVQPNASHPDGPVRSVWYTKDELLAFAGELYEGAEAALKPGAPRNAGSWCDWCPLLGDCAEFRGETLRQAQLDLDDDPPDPAAIIEVAQMMEGDALARAAKWVPRLDAFARAVMGRVEGELFSGRSVAGQKVIRGQDGNRKWDLEDAQVIKALKSAGLKKGDCYDEPKLLSPAKMEKLGPDKAVTRAKVKELTSRSPGKLKVVPEDAPGDPVPASELGAANDFDDDPLE